MTSRFTPLGEKKGRPSTPSQANDAVRTPSAGRRTTPAIFHRAFAGHRGTRPEDILALQRVYGNHAVNTLLTRSDRTGRQQISTPMSENRSAPHIQRNPGKPDVTVDSEYDYYDDEMLDADNQEDYSLDDEIDEDAAMYLHDPDRKITLGDYLPNQNQPRSVFDEHMGALADYRAAQTDALEQFGREQARERRLRVHFDAMQEARDAKTRALIAYGKKQAAKRAKSTSAPPSPTTDTPTSDETTETESGPTGITLELARSIVRDHPPEHRSIDGWQYVGLVDAAASCFTGSTTEVEHLQTAMTEYWQAQDEAFEQRRQAFDRENSDTWEMHPGEVQFLSGVTEGEVQAAKDGDGKLDSLREGHLKDQHGAPQIGVKHHQHLQSGSWGLCFMYVLNSDYTVTPYVIDIAYSRYGNQYEWENGGRGYVSGRIDVPESYQP